MKLFTSKYNSMKEYLLNQYNINLFDILSLKELEDEYYGNYDDYWSINEFMEITLKVVEDLFKEKFSESQIKKIGKVFYGFFIGLIKKYSEVKF